MQAWIYSTLGKRRNGHLAENSRRIHRKKCGEQLVNTENNPRSLCMNSVEYNYIWWASDWRFDLAAVAGPEWPGTLRNATDNGPEFARKNDAVIAALVRQPKSHAQRHRQLHECLRHCAIMSIRSTHYDSTCVKAPSNS